MPFSQNSIADNVSALRARIASAAARAGRDPNEITLMAVTKTHGEELIREAYEAGIRIFGENRVQELAGKLEGIRGLPDAEWHMIGHLQTNKAAKAAELFGAIDSIDSLKLAQKLNAAAEELGRRLAVLIEINVGGESAKSGLLPDSGELQELLQATSELRALQFRGLMTIPPFTDDPAQARPYFRRLRELRDKVATQSIPAVSMDVLSMGMSHDFEVAIAEGSTCVRVGTAIFGKRESA